ncbi:MAG: 2Fe-2S iron-sulfur cluster binding domain-containing protein [Treponema sp.]|nr:2Fe-2S iron-sulfur cluster binding domain-containing protein [Treponema sp.]
MKIPVILNGEKTILEARPDETLLTVLRRLGLFSVKKGCGKGRCGFCTVLLNAKPVPSCILPAGIVRDASIVTLEYFSKSTAYTDIMRGFEQAGLHLCGYCNSAKVFAVYDLIETSYRPTQEELEQLADSLTCSCTDRSSFINGVLYAVANRHKSVKRK